MSVNSRDKGKRGELVAMSPLHSEGFAHDSADQDGRLIQQPRRQVAQQGCLARMSNDVHRASKKIGDTNNLPLATP